MVAHLAPLMALEVLTDRTEGQNCQIRGFALIDAFHGTW